jgi:hypothetical protein
MIKKQTTERVKVGVTPAEREKKGPPSVGARTKRAMVDSTSRRQRDLIRDARTLKGTELKAFVAGIGKTSRR